jgi:hypothetical protein
VKAASTLASPPVAKATYNIVTQISQALMASIFGKVNTLIHSSFLLPFDYSLCFPFPSLRLPRPPSPPSPLSLPGGTTVAFLFGLFAAVAKTRAWRTGYFFHLSLKRRNISFHLPSFCQQNQIIRSSFFEIHSLYLFFATKSSVIFFLGTPSFVICILVLRQ